MIKRKLVAFLFLKRFTWVDRGDGVLAAEVVHGSWDQVAEQGPEVGCGTLEESEPLVDGRAVEELPDRERCCPKRLRNDPAKRTRRRVAE